MRLAALIGAACLGAWSAVSAASAPAGKIAAESKAAAGFPAEPGPAIVEGKNDAEWRPLLRLLSEKGAVASDFEEHRWFPFRTQPLVLQGEMRLAPERGLSLRYLAPEERLMIVDEKGVLLRDDRGRSRDVPPDPRAPAANEALLPVLRFDLPELTKVFEMHAARAGGMWRFDFVPRAEELRRTVGRITVLGEDARVRRLEFRRSSVQRVEIIIGETREGVTFSPDELRRFFR